jgi:hypothetical protein
LTCFFNYEKGKHGLFELMDVPYPPIGPVGAEAEEMTKTPGKVEPPKPITAAEREARKAFRQVDAEKAMTEHEIAQKAFSNNRERLKAERLAREAAGLKAK